MKKSIFRIIPIIALALFLNACGDNNNQAKDTPAQKEGVNEQKNEQADKAPGQKPSPEAKFKKKYYSFDLNKDGQVTKEEFLKRSHAEFKEKDKNHDNMIDKDECPGFPMLNPQGNPVDEDTYVKLRGERFDEMDTNKDGVISESDFVSYKMAFKKKMQAKKAAAANK